MVLLRVRAFGNFGANVATAAIDAQVNLQRQVPTFASS